MSPSTATQRRVSAAMLEERTAITIEPLVIWRPNPSLPTESESPLLGSKLSEKRASSPPWMSWPGVASKPATPSTSASTVFWASENSTAPLSSPKKSPLSRPPTVRSIVSSMGSVKGIVIPVGANVVQLSLAAPPPALLSWRVPPVTARLRPGTALSPIEMPLASTPSQLFTPCVIETRFRLAEPDPPPPETATSRCSAVALAPVPTVDGSETWPTSSEPLPVALKRPVRVTVTVPERWRSVPASTSIVGRVMPVWPDGPVNVLQSSLAAPPPARFSFTEPSVTESVSGESVRDSSIPDPSTPSQVFAPWVIETRLRLAEALPTPPPEIGVERSGEWPERRCRRSRGR